MQAIPHPAKCLVKSEVAVVDCRAGCVLDARLCFVSASSPLLAKCVSCRPMVAIRMESSMPHMDFVSVLTSDSWMKKGAIFMTSL